MKNQFQPRSVFETGFTLILPCVRMVEESFPSTPPLTGLAAQLKRAGPSVAATAIRGLQTRERTEGEAGQCDTNIQTGVANNQAGPLEPRQLDAV